MRTRQEIEREVYGVSKAVSCGEIALLELLLDIRDQQQQIIELLSSVVNISLDESIKRAGIQDR